MLNGAWWRKKGELDDAQQRIVDLPPEGNYLIRGKPGSGKTNLAVLRAAYLIRSGNSNVIVLSWGRLLNEFVIWGARGHGIGSAHIKTFVSWATEVLEEANRLPRLQGSYDDKVSALIEELDSALDDGDITPYYSVVLDEVQDYPVSLAPILRKLSDRLFMVGDENQQLFREGATMHAFENLAQTIIDIPFHYRNGVEICKVAAAIKNDPNYVASSRYDELTLPSSARLVHCATLREQVSSAVTEIQSQLSLYPNELLGIIVPRRDDLMDVIEALRASSIGKLCHFQTAEEGYSSFSDAHPICVSTVHGAKGIEFRALHVLGLDALHNRFKRSKRRNTAYTAVTRAKTSLRGYYSGQVPVWLESAFPAAPISVIALDDIFG
jgi:superfamily I DNA and RNA helicase